MTKPDWFLLIEAWKPYGMGANGPSLPFIVGALAHRARTTPQNSSEIRDLLNAMASLEVPGHYIFVSWCPTIEAPILSLRDTPKPERAVWGDMVAVEYTPLEFGSDIRSKAGLNCIDQTECIRKFADDAWESIERGNFSRNRRPTGMVECGPLTPHDILFIKRTLER